MTVCIPLTAETASRDLSWRERRGGGREGEREGGGGGGRERENHMIKDSDV